jgi:CheY-like chemotaxis protein
MHKVKGLDSIPAKTVEDSKTIMIVDDEPENREIFSRMLNSLGYDIITEPSGIAALSMIGQGAKIDLVLTDERMPDMSGLELIEKLRKMVPGVPVILITAYGSIEDYFRSSSLGVFEYVNKPVGKRELGKIIQTALHDEDADSSCNNL